MCSVYSLYNPNLNCQCKNIHESKITTLCQKRRCREENLLYSVVVPNIFGRRRICLIYLVQLPNITDYPRDTDRFLAQWKIKFMKLGNKEKGFFYNKRLLKNYNNYEVILIIMPGN
jgi:hypothetical protein